MLYGQGVYYAHFTNAEDNTLFFSRTITTANISSSVDLSPIQGGIGNPILINIPTNFQLTVELTAADFNLRGLAMQTGSTVMPNGKHRINENIVIDAAGKGTVSNIPVPEIGSKTGEAVGYIDGSIKVVIDPNTMSFTVPDPIANYANKPLCLTYTTQSAVAEYFTINSVVEPTIGKLTLVSPLYSTEGDTASGGIFWGYLQITVLRAQLQANLSLDINQTAPLSTVLSMTALADFSTGEGNSCQNAGAGNMCVITQVKAQGDIADRIEELIVVGGGLALETGESERIIVKGLTPTKQLENIPYNRLNFTMLNPTVATVNNSNTNLSLKGTVQALSIGDTDCEIFLTEKDGTTPVASVAKTRVDVEVS